MNERDLKFFLAGIATLLLIKYVIVGLNDWDGILHPERIESASTPEFFKRGLIISSRDLGLSQ